MPDTVTVLSHPQALLCKRWYLNDKGHPAVDSYGFAKTFSCQSIQVDGADDLYELLDVLAAEPKHCVIRGIPIPGQDLSQVYRRKNAHGQEPACFKEAPHQWVWVDCDLKDPEITASYSTPEGCLRAVNAALGKLPMECRIAGCWWQLSASAGLKPGLRVHFAFWLDRPLGEAELIRWGEYANEQAGKVIVDTAVFRTVQPHYTANPIFDGVVDPVALRTGRIVGPSAVLPRLSAKSDTWKRKLDCLKDPHNDNVHTAVRDACASYFCAKGPDAVDLELVQGLRSAIDHSCELRGVEDSKYTDEHISGYIAGARDFARTKAAQAENLALGTDGAPKPTLDNIRAVLSANAAWCSVLAFNERKDRPVLLAPPPFEDGYKGNRTDTYPRDYTDTDDSRMCAWLARQHQLHVQSFQVAGAVDVVAREASFDPIQDYLNGLVHDGVARIDTWLHDYLGVENSSYSRRAGAMWLIQAVARAMDPGAKADCVLCLEGAQGKKKSTALEALVGHREYFREGIGDIRSNDTLMSMQSAWITELREMANLSNREVEAQKAFLDRRNDHYRSPYGRRTSDHLRRCVFAATTNQVSYLIDETGARRFWPVMVTDIDLDALRAIRDQLWAEAVRRYRAGEQWWVEANDPDFVLAQEARYNGDERERIVAEALVRGAAADSLFGCKTAKIPPNATEVTIVQVLEQVMNTAFKDQRPAEQKAVAAMLTHLKWVKAGSVWRKAV